MSQGYIRCFYTSPDGFECENWFAFDEINKLCPVHRGLVSAGLAANGVNKDNYIEREKAIQFSLVEATKDMSDKDALVFYDEHYSKIQAKIEEMKHEQQISRALRQRRIENLTEEEREELRKAPRQVRVTKSSSANELGKEMKIREKMIANIIAERKLRGKETTREQAISILDSD